MSLSFENAGEEETWNLNCSAMGRDLVFGETQHTNQKKVIYPRKLTRPLINDILCLRCFEIKKTPFQSESDFVAILFATRMENFKKTNIFLKNFVNQFSFEVKV